MHLIIAHAVRGCYAQRCACYGRWMRTTCAGRSMRGTPTCTRTAALVAGEATGANALQAFANRAHATSKTRAIIAVFYVFYRLFIPPGWQPSLVFGYLGSAVLLQPAGADASVSRGTRFAPKNEIRLQNDLAAGPREPRLSPTSPPTSPRPQPDKRVREVSTSKRLTP